MVRSWRGLPRVAGLRYPPHQRLVDTLDRKIRPSPAGGDLDKVWRIETARAAVSGQITPVG